MNVSSRYIDHAVLDPSLTVDELKEKIMIGVDLDCKCVCVNSDAIDIAKECVKGTNTKLGVTCDFPFGSSMPEVKLAETSLIIAKGDIAEIDVVVNYGLLRSGLYDRVTEEILELSRLCHEHSVILKVIVESDALDKDMLKQALECCIAGEADYIKTSTGYYVGENKVGASLEVVEFLIKEAKGRIKVKASGGVRTRAKLEKLIELGVDRVGVGCGSTATILSGIGTVNPNETY